MKERKNSSGNCGESGILTHAEFETENLIALFHQRFDIHVAGGDTLEVQGNILEHEYEIHDRRSRVAEVSKKWFRVADTYGVDIAPGADDILILACTAVIISMTAGGR